LKNVRGEVLTLSKNEGNDELTFILVKLEQRVERVLAERSDIERGIRTAKVRMGSGQNLEGKLHRRRNEVEHLSRIIESIGDDNDRIRAQIEVEKESCQDSKYEQYMGKLL